MARRARLGASYEASRSCGFNESRVELARHGRQTLGLIGAIAAWGAIHSWLASLVVKHKFGRILGEQAFRGYRIAYNAFAVVSFIPILWLMTVLPDRILYVIATPWRYLMVAGEAAAALLLMLALLTTDMLHFAGLRQILGGESQSRLVTGGFYRWVRHPLYLFGLLILWLTPYMTINMLTVIASLTVYIIIGAALEERRLLAEFGAEYEAYRRRMPMLIPGLRLRKGGTEPPSRASQG